MTTLNYEFKSIIELIKNKMFDSAIREYDLTVRLVKKVSKLFNTVIFIIYFITPMFTSYFIKASLDPNLAPFGRVLLYILIVTIFILNFIMYYMVSSITVHRYVIPKYLYTAVTSGQIKNLMALMSRGRE